MENRTENKRQKKWLWILVAILVVATGYLYLNLEYLTRSPFDTTVEFDEPDYAAMNESGYKAVIDSFGSRVLVLSPEDEITAAIEYSALATNSPRAAYCLAMDDSTVYILDGIMNPDETSLVGERVLAYGLDGKYKGTVISISDENAEEADDSAKGEGTDYQIISVACGGGRVFAACADKNDERAVIIADVTDGVFEPIHEYSCTEGVPFEFIYQPQSDISTVITYDGKVCTWGLSDDNEAVFRNEGDAQIDKVLYRDNGEAIALDVNEDTISSYSHPQSQKILIHTSAESFDISGDALVFAEPNEYSLKIYDLATGEATALKGVRYNTRTRLGGYFAWLMVLVAVGSLIALIVLLIISGKRKSGEKKDVMPSSPKQMTTGRLYGNTFLIMIIAFAVTAIVIGRFYYNNALDKARADVIGTAFRIKTTSADGFGDDLEAIDSQKDYGTPEYEAVCEYLDNMCLRDAPADPKTAMLSGAYRFEDGTEDIKMVIDPMDYNRIGTVYDIRDQERKQIREGLGYVRDGYYNEAIVKYNNGVSLYQIYAPVYNSSEKIVGAVVISFNESGINEDIKMALATKLLEIFTLLAGLCMLVAEIRYGLGVAKIQKERHLKGIRNTTVIEADRTLNILLKIPTNVFLIFYTLMVLGILKNEGIADSAFLLALPVTLQGIAFAAFRTVASSIVKHEPKKFMYISMIICIVGLVICMLASINSSYALIIIGGIVEGIGGALSIGAGRAARLSGKKPADEYRLMVFAGMESTIACAIGASLGAVVRGIYGDTGLMILAIVLSLAAFPAIRYFVGDDIAVPRSAYGEEKSRKPSFFGVLKKNAGVLLKPKIIIATFLFTLPLSFVALFSSYVLPLLNEYEGLPDVVIGAVTLGIQLLTLFVIPGIVKWVIRQKSVEDYIPAIIMGVTAAVLLIFGADGSMKTFIIALLAVAIARTLTPTIVDDIFIEEAGKAGLVVNDLIALFEGAQSAGNYAGPMILSFMMLSGISSLGYWWGIICAVCAASIVLILRISVPQDNGSK